MTVPAESLAALREAAATRADIARVVLVEQEIAPRSEAPFVDVQVVVVLDELPSGPPGHELLGGLASLFRPALAPLGAFRVAVPSPAGLAPITRDGTVVYERAAA
ncbi:MAG TPA: hypothetical protein VHD91_11580 [Gaiellaceae bacterium]|nr:hypothetical protein [Gaiellaceae bacterium]